ncbi:class II histone deacetylase [Albimonas pacifica]|uniref:Acetoin utilization deacetylase AcuC n=1 Tax=Albimonas pacifica TaxID=1114924 RepID=A0A1I3BN60_9RHOB|nr:class II histone deacetylase [Albimonas pacifica]SFH63697.1 Acetoin utilization deacetylase AcuC [Albimonas pacifica]
MAQGKTGFVFHELYLWHNTGNYASLFAPSLTIQPGEHAENPETKRRMRNLLEVSGLLDELTSLKAEPVAEADLLRFHTPAHVAWVKEESARLKGGDPGLSPFGHGSHEIALLSAGGTYRAIQAVLAGEVANAYALARPPGHHAERDRAMGFCIYGNIPVAVLKARAELGLGRVAVVDWDVHHGNGTEQAFYDDPETLTISLHQDRLYPPATGFVEHRGEGAGEGCNINIPLPPGSGHGAYVAAFDQVVVSAIARFKPDMIVIASGFDAGANDPLGRMMLHSDTYREMTAKLKALAAELCGGRLVGTHEGGYSAYHVPYCGLAVMEELLGARTEVVDPWLEVMVGYGQMELQPHQQAAIDLAKAAHGL